MVYRIFGGNPYETHDIDNFLNQTVEVDARNFASLEYSSYILVREGFIMSKYFIIIIVNLLVFSKICTSLYTPLDVSSESDAIDWSIKIPAQEEQATHA